MTRFFEKRRPAIAAVAAAALMLSSVSAFANPPPSNKGHDDNRSNGHNQHATNDHRGADRPEFRADESRQVRDYYKQHKWNAQPLPHGKHYAVGNKVPASYRHPVPQDLRGHFQARPGYEPYIVGDNVVLIAVATGVIVDILSQVH